MNVIRVIARHGVLVAIGCAMVMGSAMAHDPGLSTVQVRLNKDRVEITMVFAVKDAALLANALNAVEEDLGTWTPAVTASALGRHAVGAVEADLDGQAAALAKATCTSDSAGNITVNWVLMKTPQRVLRVRSPWLALLPLGHRQLLAGSGPDGSALGDHLLSAGDDAVSWDRVATSVQSWRPTSAGAGRQSAAAVTTNEPASPFGDRRFR